MTQAFRKAACPEHTSRIIDRTWLSPGTFELVLEKPAGFFFKAGQRIRIFFNSKERDYSLACAPGDAQLAICIRHVPEGRVSPRLANAAVGSAICISEPFGHFLFQPSEAQAVWIATGTGIAPFRSMAAGGASGFTLIHGVRVSEELYYGDELRHSASRYYPCLSSKGALLPGAFSGRVTDFVQKHLDSGVYDFYLCGRREMIRDMMFLIDDRFPTSRIFTEMFF